MWLRLDDRLYSHPKVDTLSNAALGLWTRALSWTGDTLTDGFIPDVDMRRRFKATPAQITALVDAGLWIPDTVDGVTGWRFHNFDKWNEPATKAGVKKRRSKSRESSKTHRANSAEEHIPDLFGNTSDPLLNQKRVGSDSEVTRDSAQNEHGPPGNNQVESVNTDRVTDHQPVTLDPTRPDPDLKRGGGTSLTGVEQHDAGTNRAHAPKNGAGAPGMDRRDLCPRHAHISPEESVPPCHDCRAIRLANEHTTQDIARSRHHQAQSRREAMAGCLWCDDHGWRLNPDTGETLNPAMKCDHSPEHTFDPTG